MFELDPAFLATSEALVSLPLCEARLQLDARFPWIVLIPRVDGAVELEDLSKARRAMLMEEIVRAGDAVFLIGRLFSRRPDKLNVGQLGNITRQLHIHVVGRRADDPCWPGPVWGQGAPEPYAADDLDTAKKAATGAFRQSTNGLTLQST